MRARHACAQLRECQRDNAENKRRCDAWGQTVAKLQEDGEQMLRALRKAEQREQEAAAAEKKTQQVCGAGSCAEEKCNNVLQDVLRERETSEAARIQLDQVAALFPNDFVVTLWPAHREDRALEHRPRKGAERRRRCHRCPPLPSPPPPPLSPSHHLRRRELTCCGRGRTHALGADDARSEQEAQQRAGGTAQYAA